MVRAHHGRHRRADPARLRADGDRFAYLASGCAGGPHGFSCSTGRLARTEGCDTTISYYPGYMVRVRSTSVKAVSAAEVEEHLDRRGAGGCGLVGKSCSVIGCDC